RLASNGESSRIAYSRRLTSPSRSGRSSGTAMGGVGSRWPSRAARRREARSLRHRGVLEPVLLVRAVAERLVARLPAPAHGLAVAHLVRRPILGDHRGSPART